MKRMDQKRWKQLAWAAGGAALLAGVAAACVKGVKAVDRRLREKREEEALRAAEEELFGSFHEAEPEETEEPAQTGESGE